MKAQNPLHWMQKLGFLSLILILFLSLIDQSTILAASKPQQDPPYESVPVDTDTLVIDNISFGDKLAGKNQNPKLDTSLDQLVSIAARSFEEVFTFTESQLLRLSDGRVQVYIVTSADDINAAVQAVIGSGGYVTVVGRDKSAIQAWVPIISLEHITQYESIHFIRRPMEAILMGDMRAGSSSTEAIAAMNADAWHTAGHTGSGVKVAIIDGGFQDYIGLLGTDLPDDVTVKNFVDGETDEQVNGRTEHGTACAEIVHDIAPQAELYLAKISTNLDLQESVDWAIDQSVNIISTSMGWYNITPGDGTGEFEELVQHAKDAGILWITAASNDREAHWGGLYNDPENNDSHFYTDTANTNVFSPGPNQISLFPAGVPIRVFLRWDDWNSVDQDYDLYLLRNIYSDEAFLGWESTPVNWSENDQDGGDAQKPTEYISYITEASSAAYGFLITRYSSNRAVNFEVFAPKAPPLNFVVYPRSLSNLADVPTAMTVAALDTVDPYPQERYSSEGPTNGPGGTLEGGFVKPDLSGFANVSTESYGVGEFNGTSSATPHVSGAAALVLGANPSFTPEEIRTFLEDRAQDMGIDGIDTIYGMGRLWLGEPPSDVPSPIAKFIGDPTSGSAPLEVFFTNQSTGYYGTCDWDFGDGGTSTECDDPKHTYIEVGVYTVSLTVSGSEGEDTLSRDHYIKVEDDPVHKVFLPLILKAPPPPDVPVLNAIENPDGDGNYTVSWNNTAYTMAYILQEDDNEHFSSPTAVYEGANTSKAFSSKAVGTYYYRVKAKNDFSESVWSNVRSVKVTPPLAKVYVQNDLGVKLCYEVYDTGIGEKCFSSGKYYYGSFPAGTYTFHATASGYYPVTESKYFGAGELIHKFY